MLALTERRRRPEWGWSKLAYEQRPLKVPRPKVGVCDASGSLWRVA
jgi:hypothetical protein